MSYTKPEKDLYVGPIEELCGNPNERGEAHGAGQGAERTASKNAVPERQFQDLPGVKAEE